jgi:hypothetical protein
LTASSTSGRGNGGKGLLDRDHFSSACAIELQAIEKRRSWGELDPTSGRDLFGSSDEGRCEYDEPRGAVDIVLDHLPVDVDDPDQGDVQP